MDDEFAKIEWLKTRFELDGESRGIVVGIGDDAAVFDFGNRPAIVTVDTQVEGVHFLRDWISCADLGSRAITAAASDVWAMAAIPCASVVALTLPPNFDDESFRGVVDGIAAAARTTGARVIGGNLSSADVLSITTTVFGLPIAEPVTRRGANPGDGLYVTGTLGAAALGFAILKADRSDVPNAAPFIERWRRPPVNGRAARVLADEASAAVDVSDGCLQDLQHLCSASGVGAIVHADAIPTLPGHDAACDALGLDRSAVALGGGEDYELLFTAGSSTAAEAIATRIGVITSGCAAKVVDALGRPLAVDVAGFRHFS